MMDASVRILVLGGSGFIGRNVVAEASRRGWSVVSVGTTPGGGVGRDAVEHRAVNLANPAALSANFGGAAFDYVVNCGGYIDHTLYSRGGQRSFDAHFGPAFHLPGLLDRTRLKGFVNIGSSDEYGNQPAPQTEDMREAPISPYSAGKVAATHFLQMLWRTEEFPATTLRLFLAYGRGQDEKRFLPQVIRNCLDGCSFPVSKGEQLRDFCHVGDIVRAVFLALERGAAKGAVINIGSGNPVPIHWMVDFVKSVVGKGEPRWGEIAYRPGENMALYADISKARELLQWTPAIDLEPGIRETIGAFREQA